MPTYTYKCEDGHIYEEVRGINDDQKQTTCPTEDCNKPLKRVFDSSPVQFKGQGWAGKGSPF